MASVSSATVERDLGNLFDGGSLTGLNDRELIDRFTSGGDAAAETAFELLVARHGPMVQRVCRNVLRQQQDVEDAFQATFLVLVRQSGSIRKLDSVASWLYGVASRVAARARVDAARRRKTEQHPIHLAAETQIKADPADEQESTAFSPVVQEEVRRLPEKYRAVVLLCYWEGLTQEQAAHQLGCPIGTVRSRVARARELLRRRLSRRGLTSAWLIGSAPGVTSTVPLSPVSQNLLRYSVVSAMQLLAGRSTGEVTSTTVAALARRISRDMFMIKLRNVAIVAVMASLFVLGAQLLAGQKQDRTRQPERRPQNETPKSPVPTFKRSQLAHVIEPPDLLLVEVLEALPGRPISGERLVRPDGTITLGFYGDVEVAGLTLPEAKVKIVEHMRKFLEDETLGLFEVDPETGEPRKDEKGNIVRIAPRDTDRVFVDVTAYNSKYYYVYGWVREPGRLPITGGETVLDALSFVGGLLPGANTKKIQIMRSFPKGSAVQVLPVDYDEITTGTDASTNYQIMPNDRIVVPGEASKNVATEPSAGQVSRKSDPQGSSSDMGKAGLYFNRDGADATEGTPAASASVVPALERRLKTLEDKLDAILKRLDFAKPEPRNEAPDGKKTVPRDRSRVEKARPSTPSPFDDPRP
jgi:RNA polymerase sigma factor (sigma-70 family)